MVSSGVLIEVGLGFATPRRLGKHSQRICRLSAAFLLKLRDPIGHGSNHVARRFTSGICFYLNDWTGFFALLDYFELFSYLTLLYFEFRLNLNVSNEFLATQFPKLVKLERLDCDYACKEEATSANAHAARKKGHFLQKNFFLNDVFGVCDARKPYTRNRTVAL